MMWPRYGYFLLLLVSLTCLVFADIKYRIALRVSPRRTLITIGLSVIVFLLWDIVGLASHVFATNPRYVIGLNLVTPNLPIEEVLLLSVISYVTLLGLLLVRRRA
jgi:lycopene cyclase domain-containing protein